MAIGAASSAAAAAAAAIAVVVGDSQLANQISTQHTFFCVVLFHFLITQFEIVCTMVARNLFHFNRFSM